MKSFFLPLASITLFVSTALGTAQAPDYIIYETKFFPLFSNPLEEYKWPPESRPDFQIEPDTMSTGNYRGYVALWEIVEGRLYLKAIDSYLPVQKSEEIGPFGILGSKTVYQHTRATLQHLFPKQTENGRVFAGWYSGRLVIPDGKLLEYVHGGYLSKYEREIHITIEKGIIKNVNEKRNKETE